jgi:membrane associated rhomboid family serine protease
MNRFLARTLSTLNAVFALLIIVIATASGATGGGYYFTGSLSLTGAIFGGLGGVLVAALICGTIAFLTLIERHLSVLAEAAKRNVGG